MAPGALSLARGQGVLRLYQDQKLDEGDIMKERMFEITILALLLALIAFVTGGCNEYRPSIVDIRDEPVQIDWCPRQPYVPVGTIVNFRGYDSHFKFDNQLLTAQGRFDEVWRPYWGLK